MARKKRKKRKVLTNEQVAMQCKSGYEAHQRGVNREYSTIQMKKYIKSGFIKEVVDG